MSDYVPTPAFVEREYVTGRLRRSDVTAPEARAEFARMIAEVERAAAAKALTDAADEVLVSDWWAEDVTNSAGNVCETVREWLRTRAEAYRQERGER